jgi:kynurenine formamidase
VKRFLALLPLLLVVSALVMGWFTRVPVSAQRVVHPRETREGKVWSPPPATETFRAHPATQDAKVRVTLNDLRRWEKELSNWGRWGVNDQRGALNLITPAKSREAARLARDGVTVNLQHFVEWEPSRDNWRMAPAERWHTSAGLDAWSFATHEGTLTHMDALCHYWGAKDSPSTRNPGSAPVIFNGYPFEVDKKDGCRNLSIDKMGNAYVTRGVLVDIPRLRGVNWLEPTTPIFVSDLEEWERYAQVRVVPGDVLLVRTGRWALRDARGPWAYDTGGAGLHASVLPWLHARGVSVLVGDAVSDVQPSGVEGINRPIHQMGMVVVGLVFVDNGYLEDVAREAAARRRWEFMVTWQTWASAGGTASPWNALATF